MSFWYGFATLTVVHLLAAVSPGPDFAFVTRQAVVHGRKAGWLASTGIALGLSIHIVYSAAGLAALIANSLEWMLAIKVIGGSYLIYLGVKGLRSRPRVGVPESNVADASESWLRQVVGGFLCNALNPKAPIYFLALFTVVLSPDLPLSTLIIYGLWIMFLQWLWFSLVAAVFAHDAIRGRLMAVGHWVDRAFGVAMIALGIRVLISTRH